MRTLLPTLRASASLMTSGLFSRPLHTGAVKRALPDPHLILFVDVNGTIIAGDKERHKTRQDSIKQMLAEWRGVWDPSVTTSEMSYYDYADKYLVTANDVAGRDKQRDKHFANFLDMLSATNHPLAPRAISTFNKANDILVANRGEVFPAFTNMILELEKRRQRYSIIFRSFGTDTNFAFREIQAKTGISFSQHLHFKKGSLIDGDLAISTPERMLAMIQPGRHGQWADDFEHWDKNGRQYHAAKTYPLNSADLLNTLTVFFDDNTLDKEIINVRDVTDPHSSQVEIQQRLIAEGRLVHLETLDAILEDDHYLKYVDKALRFRQQWLEENTDTQRHSLRMK